MKFCEPCSVSQGSRARKGKQLHQRRLGYSCACDRATLKGEGTDGGEQGAPGNGENKLRRVLAEGLVKWGWMQPQSSTETSTAGQQKAPSDGERAEQASKGAAVQGAPQVVTDATTKFK